MLEMNEMSTLILSQMMKYARKTYNYARMSEFVDEMFWTKRPDCSIIRLTRRQLVSKPSVQTGNPNFFYKRRRISTIGTTNINRFVIRKHLLMCGLKN